MSLPVLTLAGTLTLSLLAAERLAFAPGPVATLAAEAQGRATTLSEWRAAYGEPTRPVDPSVAPRADGEPLLLYWMQVNAAPLGVGPAVPGTLVANFDVKAPLGESTLRSYTFLAVADAGQLSALEVEVRGRGWVGGEARVERAGGMFRELSLRLPDGKSGTLAIREGAASGGMADGRPSPTFWLKVGGP